MHGNIEEPVRGGYGRNYFYLPVVVASSVDLRKSKRAVAGEISHHVRLIYSRMRCFTLAWPVVVRLHMSQRVGNRSTASGCMHQAIENIEAFSLFQSFNLRSIFFYCNIGLVHFAEKTSLNTISADLL